MRTWIIQAALMAAVLCVGCGKGSKASKEVADAELVAVPAAPVVIPASHDEVVELGRKVDDQGKAIDELKGSVDQAIEKLTAAPEAPVIIPASKEYVDEKLGDLTTLIGSLQTIFASAHQGVGEGLESLKGTASAIQTNTELTNAKIDEQDSRLRNLEATVTNVDENVAKLLKEMQSFRDAMAAPAAAVPKAVPVPVPTPAPAAPPKRIDAAPKDAPERSVASIMIGGEWVPIEQFIAQWYRRTWSHPDSIDEHLFDTHAIDPDVLATLDRQTKEKLHSAIHEHERARGVKREVVRSKTETMTVTPAPAKPASPPPRTGSSAQNCPNGQCPWVNPRAGIVWEETRETRKERRSRGK